MKILDRYILVTYLKTFTSVFIILMFIFVLQTIWLYITELAGKDLDLFIVGKFLLFFAPKMVPLVLPLSVLLASIMVFGNFAENYEFAAMKSTGISLQRAMRSLTYFIVILAIGAFFFADKVMPWAEYNSYNLRRNIAKLKPAMAIASGQFNEIGNINIIVDSKSGDRGQYLDKVVIHQQKASKKGNYTVIVSEKGELISSEDSNILQLELTNGHYYDEIINNKPGNKQNQPHAKSYFDTYIINVDLEGLNNVDLDDKSYSNRYSMFDINGLRYTIDSLYIDKEKDYQSLANTLYNRSTIAALPTNINPIEDLEYTGNILDLFDNKQRIQILNLADNTINTSKQILESTGKTFKNKNAWLNDHIVALNQKYVIGFACIILFFVGAPLGALIRKGGLGLPMVIAVVLFLTYHFLGIFAVNSGKNDVINPAFATWVSTLVMLPLSIYLTSRATKDRGLFDLGGVLEPLKKLIPFKNNFDNLAVEGENLNFLKNYNANQLVEIIEDDDTTTTSDKKRIALSLLELKTEAFENFKAKLLKTNENFKTSSFLINQYFDYVKPALTGYITGLILILLHFVFKNNKLPQIAEVSLILGIVALGIFVLYYVISNVYYIRYYKQIQHRNSVNIISLIFGLPFFPIALFFNNHKVKTDYNRYLIKSLK